MYIFTSKFIFQFHFNIVQKIARLLLFLYHSIRFYLYNILFELLKDMISEKNSKGWVRFRFHRIFDSSRKLLWIGSRTCWSWVWTQFFITLTWIFDFLALRFHYCFSLFYYDNITDTGNMHGNKVKSLDNINWLLSSPFQ